ncbi:MAG: RNA polymerase factor sigma-54 [Muribaculaceae bacterium]|nr:RNA polymerase factor sigma-54 [Muribaculaceae bacterium]
MADLQHLTQEQTLSLRLTPQQLRYVRLLEMSAAELDEAVERELEANPALEEIEESGEAAAPDAPRVSARVRSAAAEEGTPFVVPAGAPSLYESLDEQLGGMNLSEDVRTAARYIVASLDSNGYLRRDVDSLADDMLLNHSLDISPDTVREALEVVRGLEPAGVGATSLREALMLQLRRMPAGETRDDALRILEDDFDAFAKKHYSRLVSSSGIGRKRVERAVEMIVGLNPKPGASVGEGGGGGAPSIVPDVVLERDEDGELSIVLNNRFPELTVQSSFAQAAAEMESEARKRSERKGEREYIMTNFNDARDFIRILSRRQKTLTEVMAAIIKIQSDYFATEDVYALRPMMLKDIAELTGLDLSVISRATSGKYVQTPWGIFPLRFFFSDSKGEERVPAAGQDAGPADDSSGEGVSGSGDGEREKMITNRMIEAMIRKIVDEEDKRHPLSDEKLHIALKQRGYDISRRAITKYRDRMGIPVARLRKDLF